MLGKCISGIWISKILLGEDPDPPHGLRNFGPRIVGLHTTWSAPPKPKILATPLQSRLWQRAGEVVYLSLSILKLFLGAFEIGDDRFYVGASFRLGTGSQLCPSVLSDLDPVRRCVSQHRHRRHPCRIPVKQLLQYSIQFIRSVDYRTGCL